MTKDKALEELFLAQQPLFDDQADFMATLTRRLDAVEYVRQHQEATLRHYRMAMVAAFVVGLFGGGITLALVLSMPSGTPMFAIHVQSDILQLFVDNLRTLFAAILSFLMTLASIGIFSNVHNMMVLSKYHISAQDIV